MDKLKGLHFYINVVNFNEVVLDEESKTGKVNHSIHAIDSYFSSIERFGKQKYTDIFVVEKITGSRLHMYVLADIKKAFEVATAVSRYALDLSKCMTREVAKYKDLLIFKIQVGACYGRFYDFQFEYKDICEETSIGYAANYAAKLQGMAKISNIAISANIYENLDANLKERFCICRNPAITKYNQTYFAQGCLDMFVRELEFDAFFSDFKTRANDLNLGDIEYSGVIKQINFRNLSRKDCRKVTGIPFYADIRGFTAQFDKDDSNLTEMANRTQHLLSVMYDTVIKRKGIHVQFQGDRESALFHNYDDFDCVIAAVVAGLEIIDKVKECRVSVGVGEAIGTVFVTKIGARGEKDNIILGKSVAEADCNEDKLAKENQLIISRDIYDKLANGNPKLAAIFCRVNDDCYCTEKGYDDFRFQESSAQLAYNNKMMNYNGAWMDC